jgi:DNA-binding NarL/FixJ family response regulator
VGRKAGNLFVMLVEDHAILRDILVDYIGKLPQVRACTASESAEAALSALGADAGAAPDLMLIDLSLPGMSGIELIRELRVQHPGVRCLILSGHRSIKYATEALDAGAEGYLLKGDPFEIERGLRAILQGDRYVSRSLTEERH